MTPSTGYVLKKAVLVNCRTIVFSPSSRSRRQEFPTSRQRARKTLYPSVAVKDRGFGKGLTSFLQTPFTIVPRGAPRELGPQASDRPAGRPGPQCDLPRSPVASPAAGATGMGGSRPHTAWGSLRPSSSAFTAPTATASSLRFAQIRTLTHVGFVQIWRLHRSWW